MKYTIQQWEEKKQILIASEVDLTQELTEEQFIALCAYGCTPVHWDERVAFLEANDYEVSRGNMMDTSLRSKPRD